MALPVKNNGNTLPAAENNWRNSIQRWIRAAVPFLISQTQIASENYAEHKARIASVDAYKELLVAEGKAAINLKEKFSEKALLATPEEALEILTRMRQIDEQIRTVRTISKAADHLVALPAPAETTSSEPTDAIHDEGSHWLDQFFSYARQVNEPWREDLLARAIALETTRAGSISLQTLYKISCLPVNAFHGLSHLLDITPYIEGRYALPAYPNDFAMRPISDSSVENGAIYGSILVPLIENQLVRQPDTVELQFDEATFLVTYGIKAVNVTPPKKISLRGIQLTAMGLDIAKLYSPKPITLGYKCFDLLVTKFSELNCKIENVVTPRESAD